jgi:hypothetical protein
MNGLGMLVSSRRTRSFFKTDSIQRWNFGSDRLERHLTVDLLSNIFVSADLFVTDSLFSLHDYIIVKKYIVMEISSTGMPKMIQLGFVGRKCIPIS